MLTCQGLRTFRTMVIISVMAVERSAAGISRELTHSADRITSEWVLCDADKSFRIIGGKFFEIVGEDLYAMDADVYHKENGKIVAGYRSEYGKYTLYEKEGLLRFASFNGGETGTLLYKVDLYEDISCQYFPKIEREDAFYRRRSDGRVELVESTEVGSIGRIVENHRKKLGSGNKKG